MAFQSLHKHDSRAVALSDWCSITFAVDIGVAGNGLFEPPSFAAPPTGGSDGKSTTQAHDVHGRTATDHPAGCAERGAHGAPGSEAFWCEAHHLLFVA